MRIRRAGDDAGVTLVEVVVAMSLMAIFGTMFVGTVEQIYRVANRTDAATIAQAQITTVFQRLDTQVRYAAGISTPGQGAGTDWYVEYLTDNTGTSICSELRFRGSTSQLQWRQWNRGGTPATWIVLAANVSAGTPFMVTVPTSDSAYQTLTLSLTSTVNGRTKQLVTTFAALNSSPTVVSSAYCVEGRLVS